MYVYQNQFDIDVITMTKKDYINEENDYNGYIILEKNDIIKDNKNIIDPKKLGVEKRIAQKFLKEYDLETGLIILRNEIKKAYEYSRSLAEFIKNPKQETLTSKYLNNYLSEVYNEKISGNYLNFLLDIVKNYFKVEFSKMERGSKFLNFL
jgi:hypothetical protein